MVPHGRTHHDAEGSSTSRRGLPSGTRLESRKEPLPTRPRRTRLAPQVAPLRDGQGNVVNYVGVQCQVSDQFAQAIARDEPLPDM